MASLSCRAFRAQTFSEAASVCAVSKSSCGLNPCFSIGFCLICPLSFTTVDEAICVVRRVLLSGLISKVQV